MASLSKDSNTLQAEEIRANMSQIMTFLVIPSTFASFCKLIYTAKENNEFIEHLPYIVMQLNTLIVWICGGAFWIFINQPHTNTFQYYCGFCLLDFAKNLDALSIFVYTWQFLDVALTNLNGHGSNMLRVYRNFSIIMFPLVSIALYITLALS